MLGMLVCSRFLISVCMFIVLKITVIVRAGEVIWLNPFTMVVFNVCCAVNVV